MKTIRFELNLGKFKYLPKIIQVLNQSKGCRLIGGCVRDSLLLKDVTDIDIATPVTPSEVIELFEKNNIKVYKTGFCHGTVTAVISNEKYEITTLREDKRCFGRKAEVAFTENYQLDANRRDFTINALSYDYEKSIIWDYHNGIEHLIERKVKFIGNASHRIDEDYLRILRFLRFSAKYAKEIDHDDFSACIDKQNELKNLSRERIKDELDKILNEEHYVITIDQMASNGFLQAIDARFIHKKSSLDTLAKISNRFKIKSDLAAKYAAIIHSLSKESSEFLIRHLLISNKLIKEVKFIIFPQAIQLNQLKLTWFENPKNFIQKVVHHIACSALDTMDGIKLIEASSKLDIVNWQFSGNILLKLGYHGNEIGKIIEQVKIYWFDNLGLLNENEMLFYVQNNIK